MTTAALKWRFFLSLRRQPKVDEEMKKKIKRKNKERKAKKDKDDTR
jgi:hypothetical protein